MPELQPQVRRNGAFGERQEKLLHIQDGIRLPGRKKHYSAKLKLLATGPGRGFHLDPRYIMGPMLLFSFLD